MNLFDLLALGFVALALVALYLMRACTFILAGNNVLVCRALSRIYREGAPASQAFLPSYVFSDANLSTASVILLILLVVLSLLTFVFQRRRVRLGEGAPAVPRPVLGLTGLYLIACAGATRTIFSSAYGTSQLIYTDPNLGGGHAFLCSLVLYELARRRLLFQITARRAFSIIFAVFALTGYVKGTTGLATGYLVTAAVLLLPRTGSAKRLQNVARIGGILLAIVVTAFVVRGVRASLASGGTDVVAAFLSGALDEESHEDAREGVEATANASQSAAHMLECITLYDSGVSREWRSIYDVVQYTFMPSFLLSTFNWTRPIEPAWELTHHFVHGGGINVLGEFYWNGGLFCVVLMTTGLSLFCVFADLRYRASPFWLMMVCQFAPSFLMGYGYGFPQVARGAINGLLAAGAYRLYAALTSTPTGVSGRTVPLGIEEANGAGS